MGRPAHVTTHVDDFSGLRRELEVGLALAPTRDSAVVAAKSLAALLDTAAVPVRIAGLACDGTRVRITLAVTLGTIDGIKAADDASRESVLLLARIVDQFAAYDPALTVLPAPSSPEALLAAHVTAHPDQASVLTAVRHLVAAD